MKTAALFSLFLAGSTLAMPAGQNTAVCSRPDSKDAANPSVVPSFTPQEESKGLKDSDSTSTNKVAASDSCASNPTKGDGKPAKGDDGKPTKGDGNPTEVDPNNWLPSNSTAVDIQECRRTFQAGDEDYRTCVGKPNGDPIACETNLLKAAVDTAGCIADASRSSKVGDDIHKKCREEVTKEASDHMHNFLNSENGREDISKLNEGLQHLADETYPKCVQDVDIRR